MARIAEGDRGRKRCRSSSGGSPPSRSILSSLAVPASFLASLLIVSYLDGDATQDQDAGRRRLRASGGKDRQEQLHMRAAATSAVGADDESLWWKRLWEGEDGARSMADEVAAAAAAEADYAAFMAEDYGAMPRTRSMAAVSKYADKHHFEECVGKTVAECQSLIDVYVSENSEQFNNQTSLWMDIRKVRELTDESYYKVVLRTNLPGTRIYGVFDDGMVYYPWPWRVGGVERTIGPWSCEVGGTILSPEACCDLIQEDVPDMDDYGNYLACYVEEPVGGPHNPEREDRAIAVIDAGGVVLRAPIAH